MDAGDDQGRFTMLTQTGIGRQAGAGIDGLLEGGDGVLQSAEAEAGSPQRAIGQPPRFRLRMVERQRAEPLGDLARILEIGAVIDAVPQPAQPLEELHRVAGPYSLLSAPFWRK